MQINIRTIFLLLVVMTASCSKTEEGIQADRITATIGSMPNIDIETKSILDPDGVTVKWAKGDQIAVWARNSDGAYQFSAQPFILWQFSQTYDDAKFTATIEPMPTANYDYFAVTPIPTTTDGTLASYSIPANQTGVYNGDYDIRVATPAIGKGALTEGDNSTSVNFAFSHKVHLLRIRIPKNQLGEAITELELTFPTAVTGTLTIDATDPNAIPVLTNGSNILNIKSAKPLDEGSVITATIAPIEIPDTEQIEIRAYGETSGSKPAYMPGKNFAAGRTTPIALTIPVLERKFASVELSLSELGENTLGENIHSFKITGVEGSDLGNGTPERSFDVKEAGETYTFYLGRHFDLTNNLISGQTIKATYESENTIVSKDFVMPVTTEVTKVELAVPYLLEEDFSKLSSNFSPETATEELTDKGLPGWIAGSRSQGTAKTSVLLRNYSNIGGPYQSRITSNQLTGIRTGKKVSIQIQFNCDWKKNKSSSMNVIVGSATGGNLDDAINNSTSLSLENNTSASATNIPTTRNVNIIDFMSDQRIAWKTAGKNGTIFNYDNVFIDNIKVSIVQ